MKRSLIFGSFDILHPGHLSLIFEARKHGEVHAGLALNATIRAIKGSEPLNPLERRKKNLEAYGVIAHAGHHTDRLKVVREVAPDTIILGYDQHVFVDLLEQYVQAQSKPISVIRAPSLEPEIFKSKKIRAVMEDSNAGFLLIDKPSEEPSLATVNVLRRITGIRQIGFAGTLDPLASGLLICGISKATTLLDWFHLYPKTYEAEATLGVQSDTYDSTGVVVAVSDRRPERAAVEHVLASFVGETRQTPPMFSAKKVAGKKLYEFARKGITVGRDAKMITVNSLELVGYTYPVVRFRVTCSSGTYVRSLVHDVGAALGTGAVMAALRRAAIGPYLVSAADRVTSLTSDTWKNYRVAIDEVCRNANDFYAEKFNSTASKEV